MSLWYDIKKNEYASDGRNGWLKAFCEKAIGDLKELCYARFDEICERLEKHFSGTADRHTAGDVDYDDTTTVKDFLDNLSSYSADLENDLEDEVKNRESADAALQTNINAEASTRKSADATLQTNINNEAAARKSADATLQTNIDNVADRVESIDVILENGVIRITCVDLSKEGCDIQDSFSLDDCVPEESGSYKMYCVLYNTENDAGETEVHSVLLYSTYGRLDGHTAYTQYYTDVDGVSYYRHTNDGNLDDWTEWEKSVSDVISASNVKMSNGKGIEITIDVIETKLSAHLDGTAGRHEARDIDYNDTTTVQDYLENLDNFTSTLSDEIDEEVKNRKAEDVTLQTNIDDLSETLQNLTNNVQTIDKNLTVDIQEEESAREQADTALQSKITALEARIAALEA